MVKLEGLFACFDEEIYLAMHPDVAAAVGAGSFKSGFHHYLDFGFDEGRPLKSRTDTRHGRIVIAGTGRAGTTLLVQIFTALGFDTGFSLPHALQSVDSISHAGLEQVLDEESPVVVKWPWVAEHFQGSAIPASIGVTFLILPMRDLTEAAESRRRVQRAAADQGNDREEYPGGLWLTKEPSEQEGVLARQFYETAMLALRSDISATFLEFPRFAREPAHLWRALLPLWLTYGVEQSDLLSATSLVADTKKITVGPTQKVVANN